jgi:hypothetical protein
MRLLHLSNNSFDPGTPFEDEVLVPEDAKTQIPNALQSFIRTNTLLEIPLEVEASQRNPDPIEDKRDDSRTLNRFTVVNKMLPFCQCIANASTPEPSLT